HVTSVDGGGRRVSDAKGDAHRGIDLCGGVARRGGAHDGDVAEDVRHAPRARDAQAARGQRGAAASPGGAERVGGAVTMTEPPAHVTKIEHTTGAALVTCSCGAWSR